MGNSPGGLHRSLDSSLCFSALLSFSSLARVSPALFDLLRHLQNNSLRPTQVTELVSPFIVVYLTKKFRTFRLHFSNDSLNVFDSKQDMPDTQRIRGGPLRAFLICRRMKF